MRKLLSIGSWLALVISAMAQPSPGPGPAPSPWGVNGPAVYYNNGGLTIPSYVTGGNMGVGTINVTGGYYVNGVPTLSTIPTPTTTTLGGVKAGTAPTNYFMSGIALTGAPIFTQPAFSNLSGSATVAQGGTGCTSASGTCLDNITAFSSLGIITRTGSGGYSFTPPGSGVLTAAANPVNGTGGFLTYSLIGTSGATLPLNNTQNNFSQPFTVAGTTTPTIIQVMNATPGNQPPAGAYLNNAGTYFEYCPVGVVCGQSPSWVYLYAQSLFNTSTRLDATAQEVNVAINYENISGYAPHWYLTPTYTNWAASTGYANSVYVKANGNFYQQVSGAGCTSSTTAPSGISGNQTTANNFVDGTCDWTWEGAAIYTTGTSTPTNVSEVVGGDGNIYVNTVANCTPGTSNPTWSGYGAIGIVDGTCRWNFLATGINNGKTTTAVSQYVVAGGGNGWNHADGLSIGKNVGGIAAYGEEWDCNNFNMDSYAGSPFQFFCHFLAGGGPTSFPFFAGWYYGSGAVNSGSAFPYGMHYGTYISGSPGDVGSVVKDAVIGDGGNSTYTVQALSGRAHTAFLEDDSNSTNVLKINGSHAVALNMAGGTFSAPPVTFGSSVSPSGCGGSGELVQLYGTAGARGAGDYSIGINFGYLLLCGATGGIQFYGGSGGTTLLSQISNIGVVQGLPVAIASLPTCGASIVGSSSWVNNGVTSPTYHATVSTTGTGTWPVYCTYNGTSYAWVY